MKKSEIAEKTTQDFRQARENRPGEALTRRLIAKYGALDIDAMAGITGGDIEDLEMELDL